MTPTCLAILTLAASAPNETTLRALYPGYDAKTGHAGNAIDRMHPLPLAVRFVASRMWQHSGDLTLAVMVQVTAADPAAPQADAYDRCEVALLKPESSAVLARGAPLNHCTGFFEGDFPFDASQKLLGVQWVSDSTPKHFTSVALLLRQGPKLVAVAGGMLHGSGDGDSPDAKIRAVAAPPGSATAWDYELVYPKNAADHFCWDAQMVTYTTSACAKR